MSRCRACEAVSNTNRSVSPPTWAEKTIRRPSGEKLGSKISSTSLIAYSFTWPPSASRRLSAALPSLTAPNTNRRPVASQLPEELMNWRLWKCGSVAVLISLRRMSPVRASAR